MPRYSELTPLWKEDEFQLKREAIKNCKYRKKSPYWDERDQFLCTNPNGCVCASRVLGTLYCGGENK